MMLNGNNPWRVKPNGQKFFPMYNLLKEPTHEHFEKDMNWSENFELREVKGLAKRFGS